MFEFMVAMKAIGDSNRVRILCALEGRELCACQLIKMLDLAPSTVSKHLSILRQARLVVDRKEGRWMHYRLPDKPNALTKRVLRLMKDSLSNEKQIGDDQKRVLEILAMSKEELCRIC